MIALKDVMTRHFEWIHPDASVKEAVGRMDKMNLSMLPVCEDDHVVGVLAEPQLARTLTAVAQDPAAMKVRDVMISEVLTGRESQDVRDVIPLMRQRKIPVLPVLDSEECVVGIFSLGGPWRRSPQ